MRPALALFTLALLPCALTSARDGAPMTAKTAALLQAGQEPVRIVCFGDSITGVYYHTGGRRAWHDMLALALQRLYPQARIEMTNAGISGHTTVDALARIDRDVLAHRPHLVVVMFGMNDVTRVPPESFRANLAEIVQRCRGVGAEVVLCTPNSVYPEDSARPVAKLAAYAQIVRDVAAEQRAPLADCYQAYEDVRARDRRAWMALMSETIHPNMRGHKLFAEVVAQVVSGKRVSLDDEPPPFPALPRTLSLLAKHQPVKVLAMPPYDTLIPGALKFLAPDARAKITTWPTEGQSLAQIEAWSKTVRDLRPDLVVVAVPATAAAASEEQFLRSYSWVLNWSLSFGYQEWDCIAILPSVADPMLSPTERAAETTALEVIEGQDIGWLQRAPNDETPAGELLAKWFLSQARRP